MCPVEAYAPVIADSLARNVSQAYDGSTTVRRAAWRLIISTNLSKILQGVATSLTNLNFETSNESVTGHVTITESHVHVTWNWLILPWVLEVLVITALLMANLQAPKQKARIWRSSVLRLLSHGIEEPMGDQGGVFREIEQYAARCYT